MYGSWISVPGLAMSGDANYQLKGRFSQPLDEIWVIARREERFKAVEN